MLLRTLYDEKLAQASYLIGCQMTGEAIVIDPNRDVDQYMRAARKEGLRITHVTETHIHADFVSGTRELAQQTGAAMYLSHEGGPDWQYGYLDGARAVQVGDGDVFDVGNIHFQVMHTPGHTPEHICFLVTDGRNANQPMGIVTGDFVFVGDVGRPDLLEKAAGVGGTMRDAARALYHSIQRFLQLPDYLQVWPGHGAGSACGKALGAVPQSTVGYEKMFSPALTPMSEEEFVDWILAGQPEPPRYFAQMKRINRAGPPILGKMPSPPKLTELVDNMTIVDTRTALAFGRGHIKGTINIPYNKSFTTWCGWLLSYDKPFALIADERNVPEIVRDLTLIGLDNIAGYYTPDAVTNHEQTQLPAIKTAEMETAGDLILDVRGRHEYEHGHIPGAINIPVGYLPERAHELPRDKQIVVHCEGGGRSAIASSLLQSMGFNVLNVQGGYREWAESGKQPVFAESQ
jgi:hydroxyacylglutathione hydrolase